MFNKIFFPTISSDKVKINFYIGNVEAVMAQRHKRSCNAAGVGSFERIDYYLLIKSVSRCIPHTAG